MKFKEFTNGIAITGVGLRSSGEWRIREQGEQGRQGEKIRDFQAQPVSSIPQACGDIAATSAAYDFWNSPYFQPSDIRNAHIKSTIERIKEHDVILAIQDTTNIDLTDHPATSGLGYLDQIKSSGLKVHSTFATTINGVPLGIINQQVWAREPENLGIAKKRCP